MKNMFVVIAISLFIFTEIANGEEPSNLTSLRKKWQDARARAVEPLDRKYGEALNKMKDVYTKEGKLEEALIIQSEIENLFGKELDAVTLVSRKWTFRTRRILTANEY